MGTSITNLEKFLLEEFDTNSINNTPKTEQELLVRYAKYTDILYQYIRVTINPFVHPLNNEIRAIYGHLAEYRMSENTKCTKRDLEKAYGHFRRFNLDALKILCDEFDSSLWKILQKQYRYDYRDSCIDYLKNFGIRYFRAKELYIKAQKAERLGCDSPVHNIIELYYVAAKEYIQLKQYYQKNKKIIHRTKMNTIIKQIIVSVLGILGIAVSILKHFV